MKILHLSTWKEVCGIANYTKDLVNCLDEYSIYNQVYPVNKLKLKYLSLDEIKEHFLLFCEKARDFDIIHIQHEHSFFHGSYPFGLSLDLFYEILKNLKKQKKKVFVTFHTEPIFIKPLYTPLIRRNKYSFSDFINTLKWRQKIAPFFQGNRKQFTAIVHSKKSRLSLIKSGFSGDTVKILKLGVTKRKNNKNESESIENSKLKINLPPESRLLSIFGFVSSYKGYKVAVEALNFLPDNYYLAIIGGTHPTATNDNTLDQILRSIEIGEISAFDNNNKLLLKESLKERILITGFVDFDTLNLFHEATDICLAPYLSNELSASAALTWALNSGKPTIASKISAFCELNEDADCLLLVTPNAPNELAWQILKLEQDAKLRQHLVHNALKYTQENSWDNVSSELVDIYKSIVSKF